MPNEVNITPEAMRALLRRLGAVQESNHDAYKLAGVIAWVDHWVSQECREPWFVLACADYLESEQVRKAGLQVNFSNGNLVLGDDPLTSIHEVTDNGMCCLKVFTGPFSRRVVETAAWVAVRMEEKK